MKKAISLTAACLAIAGCAAVTNNTSGGGPNPPPGSGYANGSSSVATPNIGLGWTGAGITTQASSPSSTITGVGPLQVTLTTTSDPNVMILRVGGTNITLNKNLATGDFYDSSLAYGVHLVPGGSTSDGQMVLALVNANLFGTGQAGLGVYGLPTYPGQMPTAGNATYSGAGMVVVDHGTNSATVNTTSANATTTLNANFSAGTISGSMSLTELASSTGFAIPAAGTTLMLNPATITGNSFSGTWSVANLGDLHLSSIGSAAYNGGFFGVSAADVGGSLSAIGVSADGVTPAFIFGGFMGQ